MSTTRSFQSMLNQYLPLDLLKEELIKRDYLMQKVDHVEDWKGGDLIVPFEGQHASTIEFGALAADTDIAQYKYIRGSISTQPEVWASLLFNQRDLMEHDGRIPESTFLKILPNQIEGMMMYFKMCISVHLLNASLAKVTVDGTNVGVLEVDRIDRFTIDQKCVVDDGNSSPLTVYVIAINVNGGTLLEGAITVSATRGGAAADVSAYTVAQGAALYHPGAQASGMTTLPSQLLSLANGGTTNLFGVAKTAWSFLQAVQIDGSAVSATNILTKIFDGYTKRQKLAKSGKIPEVLMSYKHMGSVLKIVEGSKGAFNVQPGSMKASQYGWQEVSIGSVSGHILKMVAVQEMADSEIYYLDWDGIKFYSNGLFKRRKAPDGKEYFEIRATTGYSYILDHCLFGDLVVTAPWKQAVMFGIPAY